MVGTGLKTAHTHTRHQMRPCVCVSVCVCACCICICAESELHSLLWGNVACAIGLAGFICLSPFSVYVYFSTFAFAFTLAFATAFSLSLTFALYVCVLGAVLVAFVIRGVKWIFYFYYSYYDFIVFRVSVFSLLLVFSRRLPLCLSGFAPFALRLPFAFCNFRKNS